jgi:hypothetical protein
MSLRQPYEGRGLEDFDVFSDDEDEATVIMTLTVEHGTFTIALDPRMASQLSRSLAAALRR